MINHLGTVETNLVASSLRSVNNIDTVSKQGSQAVLSTPTHQPTKNIMLSSAPAARHLRKDAEKLLEAKGFHFHLSASVGGKSGFLM